MRSSGSCSQPVDAKCGETSVTRPLQKVRCDAPTMVMPAATITTNEQSCCELRHTGPLSAGSAWRPHGISLRQRSKDECAVSERNGEGGDVSGEHTSLID